MALRRSSTSARIGFPFQDACRDDVCPVRRIPDTHIALQTVGLPPQHSGEAQNTSNVLGVCPAQISVFPYFRQNPPLPFRAATLAIASPVRHGPSFGVVNRREPRFAVLFDKQANRLNGLPCLSRFRAAAKFNPPS